MRLLFTLFFLLSILPSLGQHPSYYYIGSNELEGVRIYDIHQANNGIYWIATDNGVMKYDGYSFENLPCQEMLSTSVFRLVEDYEGNLYCHNLSGQIFQIRDGQCSLYFSIPDSLMSADISTNIDNQNQLVISARNLFSVTAEKKVRLLQKGKGSTVPFGEIHRRSDSTLCLLNYVKAQFLFLKNDSCVIQDLILPESERELHQLVFNDQLYVFNTKTFQLYLFDRDSLVQIETSLQEIPAGQIMRYRTTDQFLWMSSLVSGVYQIDTSFTFPYGNHPLFPRTFISTIHKDAESNILLGTFGNGIIIIPKTSTENLTFFPDEEEFISVTQSASGDLFFGSRTGKVYRFNSSDELQLFRNKQVKSVEALFALNNQLLIGEVDGMIIDLASGLETDLSIGSLKDVCEATPGQYYLACNKGAYLLDAQRKKAKSIPELQLRLYCIGFDSNSSSIYAGTAKGLAILNNQRVLEYKTLKGVNIAAQDIETHDGLAYIATAQNGILVYQGSQLKRQWSRSSGLLSNRVSSIKIIENRLFLSTDRGIQVLNLQGETTHIINRSDGLYSENIQDFEVRGNELWVVYGKGVQRVLLNQLEEFTFNPHINFTTILVNDSISVFDLQGKLEPSQKNIAFRVSVNTLRYQREVFYEYKLEGADQVWQRNAFEDNQMEYRSLAPGDYTFKIRAICRDRESEMLTYAFTIATPFWKAWWFYPLIALGVVVILTGVYRARLKAQEQRANQINELNASRLIAIRSQMNPHFIFNALNSIQDLVLKGDIDNSYTYITKFANLVRKTLNDSDKEFVEFRQEIQLIELYLTLEQLRFKNDFEFTINDSGIEDILIPPMLIQPFIENALVHGLLHKKGAKRLMVEFKLEEGLTCIITDNGIGREQAREIKRRQKGSHESFSVKAIRKRFEIFEKHFAGSYGVDYEDLFKDGKPCGTRVMLSMPVQRTL